jgi:hypothetical protein
MESILGWFSQNIEIFLWGLAGSFSVEIVTLYRLFLLQRITIPERYRVPAFWAIRFFLTITAGILAVAYDVQEPLQALCLGAAAPIIIEGLAKGLPPSNLPEDKGQDSPQEDTPL